VFASSSITDLPFIELDSSFRDVDWQWSAWSHSYLLRFALARYPRWSKERPEVSQEAAATLNAALIEAFRKRVLEDHSTPIVLWLPSRSYFELDAAQRTNTARRILEAHRIPYEDLGECVSAVNESERFLVRHYSPGTNAAVARCLRNRLVREHQG